MTGDNVNTLRNTGKATLKMDYRNAPGRRLCLADGRCWWLTATDDILPWFHRLATIMELQECALNGAPKLAFSRMDGSESSVAATPMKQRDATTEWQCYDYETARIWTNRSVPDAVCEVELNEGHHSEYMNMWRSLQPIYQRCLRAGGMPFHAALVELEGRGILIAASGGTGKSTSCRRLPDYWKPLCDDETFIVFNEQKEYQAHPFPTWSDYVAGHGEKTWNVQYSVPVSGIFFLEKSEKDEVIPLGRGHAAALINESASQVCRRFWPKVHEELQIRLKRELVNNACKMAQKIPAFRLRASLHGRFWEEIEKALE